MPAALDELVPEILEDVPSDPFDPTGGPLRYRRTDAGSNFGNDNGYLLYSVGCNTIDDDGAVPYKNGNLNLHVGDLRLDAMYAPEPEPSEEDEPG